MRHIPVLLKEILQGLNIPKGGVYVDCNLGDGGHSEAVIESLGGDVTVIGFDLDKDAITRAKENIKNSLSAKNSAQPAIAKNFDINKKLYLFRKNFRTLEETISKASIDGVKDADDSAEGIADAILFDLGISSYELEESGRGFTFQKEEPLKMTFGNAGAPVKNGSANASEADDNVDHAFTAYDIINTWQEENIADIIYAYGEDKYSRRIAKAIVERREALKKEFADANDDKSSAVQSIAEGADAVNANAGIATTTELADIIKKAYPSFARFGKIHPATRTFQALRIAVNDELRAIQDALPQAMRVLKPGGRLAVISFHSLEDRIVKRFFKAEADNGTAQIITKRPIAPSEEERLANPRSRSSKLRILEKN